MKPLIAVISLLLLFFDGFSQLSDIQYITFKEDNSALQSSVCYNWNQAPNGAMYVSGNGGFLRFDGLNFTPYPTHGRGKAMSSSMNDPLGRLWCNSFHGDIYYAENDSLIRHPISDSIRTITYLVKIGTHFYIRTDQRLYEVNQKSLEIKRIGTYSLVHSVFEHQGSPFILFSNSKGEIQTQNLETLDISTSSFPIKKDIPCRYIYDDHDAFLFFEQQRFAITISNFMQEKFDQIIHFDYPEKINYCTLIDGEFVICGMNGVEFYNQSGVSTRKLLSDVQLTHFGKDQEGNYIGTSMTEGLIIIPDLQTFKTDFEDYLEHDNIIRSEFDGERFLYLGTNAGKILRYDLITQEIKILQLGLRSEVLSMQFSSDKSQLYFYCDALFTLDLATFTIKRKLPVSSIKQMALCNKTLILGTRKGIILKQTDENVQLDTLGWTISLLPLPEMDICFISTKNGLFKYHFQKKKIERVLIPALNHERTISHLNWHNGSIYFIYDNQEVYRCSIDFSQITNIYHHKTNDLNGFQIIQNRLQLFSKGSVTYLQSNGIIERKLSLLDGLNGQHTSNAFIFEGRTYYIHRKSLSIYNAIPRMNTALPELGFHLSPQSTFHYTTNQLQSEYEDNNLIFHLDIRRALRSRGELMVYYRLKDTWKKLENPYDEVHIERLPIGHGMIQLKAITAAGITSPVLEIPFYIKPPFYLTSWFIALIAVIIILLVLAIIRWRVRSVRKKTLARLQKQKLESRALHAELTAIRSQMNPHFIFNVLTAIQAKVIQGKVSEAYSNIGDFAILIRNVLEKSGKEYITIEDEIALMKNYVELENSRLIEKIQFTVKMDDADYFDDMLIPTLITQPIIENAIKHAFNTEVDEPTIELKAFRNTDGFTIIISDNGSGFNTKQKENHHSFALSALRKRIEALRHTSPYIISLEIKSDTTGTEVKFTFKIKTT